jgi:SAM-dependent methyltransferase
MKPQAHEQFESLERDHWWFRARRRVYLELLRTALAGTTPERILDVGAGVGGFLGELQSLGGRVHHTELHPESLLLCRRRGFRSGVRAAADSLPYQEMSFDLVCLFDVLEHVDDDQQVLHEIARVLRPEGLALITVPAYPWLFSENDRIAEHRRRYTRASLRGLIDRAHLGEVRCTHTNTLLFPAIAAYIVAGKTARRLGALPPRSGRTNLSLSLPPLLNEACYRAFTAELYFSRRWNLPAGHSILALVRKRDLLLTPVARQRRAAGSAGVVEGSFAGG